MIRIENIMTEFAKITSVQYKSYFEFGIKKGQIQIIYDGIEYKYNLETSIEIEEFQHKFGFKIPKHVLACEYFCTPTNEKFMAVEWDVGIQFNERITSFAYFLSVLQR